MIRITSAFQRVSFVFIRNIYYGILAFMKLISTDLFVNHIVTNYI